MIRDRRALAWWRIFTVPFWLAPLVTSWQGIALARLAEVACIVYLWRSQMGTGYAVPWSAVVLWALVFGASEARNFREMRQAIATALRGGDRREHDSDPTREDMERSGGGE